jgi:hypothetical protein
MFGGFLLLTFLRMTIQFKKFGEILVSRQDGREAFAAFRPTLLSVEDSEEIVVDFDGVMVFAPSWGDEFLRQLFEMFGYGRVVFKNTSNSSVQETLKFLEKLKGEKFRIE